MNPDRLLAHFDRLVEAPDAIPRLRRFILDLAVRGKLVEQDPKDESAAEMLERIRAKRKALASTRIRSNGDHSHIEDDEIPYPFIAGTVFARLEEVARIEKGTTAIQRAVRGPFPLVALAEERATSAEYQFDTAAAIVPLISSTGHGHASLKRMHYQEGKFALGNILCAVIPFAAELISARFLYEYLWAYKEPLLVEKMLGTANVSLTIGKIAEAPVPIISPRAQARLHELMALCDRLEAAKAERESRRDLLAAASLHRLNDPADPEDLREHARFHLRHLPQLTTRAADIDEFRQFIINIAVCGKLVGPSPSDEPIHRTLDEALARRAALVRAKKVRHKKLDDYDALTKAIAIPAHWAVERLGNLVDPENTISYGVLVPGNEVSDGVPFVRAQDLSLKGHPIRPNKTISPEIEKPYARTRLRGGEILVCVVGSIGKLGIVPPSWAGAILRAQLLGLRQFRKYRENTC